jgi:hypothetical protein
LCYFYNNCGGEEKGEGRPLQSFGIGHRGAGNLFYHTDQHGFSILHMDSEPSAFWSSLTLIATPLWWPLTIPLSQWRCWGSGEAKNLPQDTWVRN